MKGQLGIKILIALIFVLNNKSNGQTFPTADWRQGIYFSGNFYQSPPDLAHSIQYVGDTSLCSYSYNIIKILPSWTGASNLPYNTYIRKQAGKIYERRYGCANQESILYDFNLLLNDTIDLQNNFCYGYKYVVDSVSTLTLLNNQTQKFIRLIRVDPQIWYPDTIRWIEDIGDIDKGFFPECDFEGGRSHFICHKENGQTVWINNANQGIANCDSVTPFIVNIASATQLNSIDEIKVSPNPFDDYISVKAGKSDIDYSIVIYDITSKILTQKEFRNEEKIDTKYFSRGVYYYQIKSTKGILKTGKLVR